MNRKEGLGHTERKEAIVYEALNRKVFLVRDFITVLKIVIIRTIINTKYCMKSLLKYLCGLVVFYG